ncbi:hypothetical protein [Embleya sp. NBC_00896]|uniref:hypothetical protein n=1 Tax=Embleya sp. NBC_00896 TaxID=2975961 RepID=UPI00386DD2E4|nr:hypothetical protein OG928_00635 [Embleya sp. NBC_00896]
MPGEVRCAIGDRALAPDHTPGRRETAGGVEPVVVVPAEMRTLYLTFGDDPADDIGGHLYTYRVRAADDVEAAPGCRRTEGASGAPASTREV